VSIAPITANAIIIYIIERNNFNSLQSNIALTDVTAGFEDIEDDDTGGAALRRPTNRCTPDVLCFPDKLFSARAVALIFVHGGTCTGTLVNNEANDGRAFLLTAFHCVDFNENKTLEPGEINEYLRASFQFHAWKTACGGNIKNRFIEYTGATLRAANKGSDFALFELNNPPGVGDDVNYAGWNRQEDRPSNSGSYIIHHPRGTEMRLTQTRTVRNFFWNLNYWQAYYAPNAGAVSPGSSGSALFNENDQIIGQLKGGWTSCFTQDMSDRYGKFYRSWTGSGTNDTRLSNWLSPTQDLYSIGTLVSSNLSIQGANEVICTNEVGYSVTIRFLDATYDWSVSNNLQIISGLGTPNIVVRAINNGVSSGFIRVIVRTPTKGHIRAVTLTKNVTVRTSGSTTGELPITGPTSVSCGQIVNYYVSDIPGAGYQWSYPSSWIYDYGQGTSSIVLQIPDYAYSSTSGEVRLITYDACGSILSILPVYSSCGEYYYYYSMSPNPASSTVTISAKETTPKGEKIDKTITEINIYDQQASLKKHEKFSKVKTATVNISGLNNGVYIVEIVDGNFKERQKLIIQK